jgi:hypothetical protein
MNSTATILERDEVEDEPSTKRRQEPAFVSRPPFLALAFTAIAVFFLHGYHLGVEDSEIYLPAVKKLINPALFKFAPEFFLSHGHLSIFSPLLAWTARLTHLSADWTILAWYLLTIYLMVWACWMVASSCFESLRARWCAVLLVAAVFTMPATNTGLLLMDPYLTARSLSTPLTLLAISGLLDRKFVRAAVATVLTALVHPQMVVYLLFLMVVLGLRSRARARVQEPVPALASFILILPGGFHLSPATGPYREALYSRDYFFLSTWSWYHWLGMLAPLAILAWFWRAKLRNTRQSFACLSFVMIPFGLLSILAAGILSSSHIFDMFARLQPLRSFHLITIVFILLLGGVLGEYLAEKRKWAVAALVAPVALGMCFVDYSTYPASPHIEWPSATSTNAWINALLWIRTQTPQDAVFAVDSHYFLAPGVDTHGFRAISERSALADYYKDSGVVSLFPSLAPEWKQMSDATLGLNQFSFQDFRHLQTLYPAVSWTLIHGNAPSGLVCPYRREGYSVCKLPPVATGASTASAPNTASHMSQNAPQWHLSGLEPEPLFWQNQTGKS